MHRSTRAAYPFRNSKEVTHASWTRVSDIDSRRQPFGGGFAIACGLADVIAYLRDFAFNDDEISYLAMLAGNSLLIGLGLYGMFLSFRRGQGTPRELAVIADKCPSVKVTVVDINAERISAWNGDDLPIYEPGLDAVLSEGRADQRVLCCFAQRSGSLAQRDLALPNRGMIAPLPTFGGFRL